MSDAVPEDASLYRPARIALLGRTPLARFRSEQLRGTGAGCVVAASTALAGWPDARIVDPHDGGGWIDPAAFDRIVCAEPMTAELDVALSVALQAGVPVDVELASVAASSAGLLFLESWAESAGSSLLRILGAHRLDPDYRRTRAAFESGSLGPLTHVRNIQWGQGPVGGTDVGHEGETFAQARRRLIAPWLDQFLSLLGHAAGEARCHVWTSGGRAVGFTLTGSAAGVTGSCELRRDALVPLGTGWIVDGERGGYRSQKLYRLSADGEVSEEPWDPLADAPAVAGGTLPWESVAGEIMPLAEALKTCQVLESFLRKRSETRRD